MRSGQLRTKKRGAAKSAICTHLDNHPAPSGPGPDPIFSFRDSNKSSGQIAHPLVRVVITMHCFEPGRNISDQNLFAGRLEARRKSVNLTFEIHPGFPFVKHADNAVRTIVRTSRTLQNHRNTGSREKSLLLHGNRTHASGLGALGGGLTEPLCSRAEGATGITPRQGK